MFRKNGAGEGVRTLDPQLGRLVLYQLSYTRLGFWSFILVVVAREGFEPSKEYSGRFTVCSLWPLGNHAMELLTGLEPATAGLQNRCSTN